jgi:hypothetical protein
MSLNSLILKNRLKIKKLKESSLIILKMRIKKVPPKSNKN